MTSLAIGVGLGGVYVAGEPPELSAPTITAVSTWQAAPRVGEPLEFTAATVTGYPGPTVTYAIYNGDPAGAGVLRLAATTYALASAWEPEAADEGDALYIVVAASNGEAPDATATSAASDAVLAAFVAPSATILLNVTDRTVTAWLGSVTGTPDPLPATLDTFTANAVDVTGSVTGTGTAGDPWTYVVPSSASSTSILVGASLSNVAGSWDDTATTAVAADLSAPTASNDLADLTLTVGLAMTPVDVSADFDLGNPEAAIALQSGTLPAGLSFDGTTLSGTPTTEAGAVSLVFRATNSVGTADSGFSVTVNAASALPTNMVFIGASIVYDIFDDGSDLVNPNSSATTELRALADTTEYDGINVYAYGVPALGLTYHNTGNPDFANGLADALDDVLAAFPDDGTTWYVIHIGGTDVTSQGYRPAETMFGSEVTAWNADVATAMTAITSRITESRVWVSSISFRDYSLNDSCFYDELLGSAPFNDGIEAVTNSGGTVTGLVEYLAANMTNSIASYGRPKVDLYRFVKSDYETYLGQNGDGGDQSHPGTAGQAAIRTYLLETLDTILRGAEPAELADRTAGIVWTEQPDGSWTGTYDGGASTVMDSLTLSDPDAELYWEATYTEALDPAGTGTTAIDLSLTGTYAALCLALPTTTLTTDADSSGTTSQGDTISISDVGVWLVGDNDTTFAVAWYDDQGVIPAATGLTYTLAAGQAGETVYPVITASATGRTDVSEAGSTLAVDAGGAAGWETTDNGDGTFTVATSPTPPLAPTDITDNGDGTYSLLVWATTDNANGTFTVTSSPVPPAAPTSITDNGDGTFTLAA